MLRIADVVIWMSGSDPEAPTIEELSPVTWDREGLVAKGWEGFVPFSELRSLEVPKVRGVYAVLREETSVPEFMHERPHHAAGQFSPYSAVELASCWVPGAKVLYVDRAPSSLHRSLRGLRLYGTGERKQHHNGRAIWQLPDSERLIVAWRYVPRVYGGLTKAELKSGLIKAFEDAHNGAKPFANAVR